MKTIADRVREIQADAELNDPELAKLVGVSKATVGKWKNQNSIPSGKVLVAIREKLGINEAWLVTGKGPKKVQVTMDEFTKALTLISPDLDDEAKREILDFARYKAELKLKHKQ